jgi:hypothetical protein
VHDGDDDFMDFLASGAKELLNNDYTSPPMTAKSNSGLPMLPMVNIIHNSTGAVFHKTKLPSIPRTIIEIESKELEKDKEGQEFPNDNVLDLLNWRLFFHINDLLIIYMCIKCGAEF